VNEQAGHEIKGVGTPGAVTVGGVTGGARLGTLAAVDMSHKPWYKRVVNKWATRGAEAGNLAVGTGTEGSSEATAAQPTSIYHLYPPEAKTSNTVYAQVLPQGTPPPAHTAIDDTRHTGRMVEATDPSGARQDTGEEERKQLEAVMAQPEVVPRNLMHLSCVPFPE
jgi:hypothetical protein